MISCEGVTEQTTCLWVLRFYAPDGIGLVYFFLEELTLIELERGEFCEHFCGPASQSVACLIQCVDAVNSSHPTFMKFIREAFETSPIPR